MKKPSPQEAFIIKDIILKEMSHASEIDMTYSNILNETETGAYEELEKAKSENEKLRQKLNQVEKDNKKYKKKVSALKERIRQNEEYMEMLREEMVKIHRENKFLSSEREKTLDSIKEGKKCEEDDLRTSSCVFEFQNED